MGDHPLISKHAYANLLSFIDEKSKVHNLKIVIVLLHYCAIVFDAKYFVFFASI